MPTIKKYTSADEAALFSLMQNEGSEWESYWGNENRDKYKTALKNSIVYTAYKGNILCGYCRCRDDGGYGIYIYDLLVDIKYRGSNIGRKLIEQVYNDYPDDAVYVMSDVDIYYEKQGFKREGSIFEIRF